MAKKRAVNVREHDRTYPSGVVADVSGNGLQ